MVNDAEHLCMCLMAGCMSSLEKCLFRSFAHFLIRLFIYLYFFAIELYEFLKYILGSSSLSDIWFGSILEGAEFKFSVLEGQVLTVTSQEHSLGGTNL